MIKNLIYVPSNLFDCVSAQINPKEVGKNGEYNFKSGNTSKKSSMTRYAKTCSIFVCNNRLYHIAPETADFTNLKSTVKDIVYETLEKDGFADVFVIGGKKGNNDSERLFYDIGNFSVDAGADLTMIGLKNVPVDVFPYPVDAVLKTNQNQLIFTQEYNYNMEYDISQSPKYIIDHLQTYYDYIEICPKHMLSAEFNTQNLFKKLNVKSK